MLWAIWISSVILSLVSLIVMVALILRRLVLRRGADARSEQRQRLQKALIEFSETRDADVLRQVMNALPPAVVLEAGFEFLALLRGDEHARIIAVFTEVGLVEQATRLLQHGNKTERVHAAEMLGAFANADATAALLAAFDIERSDDVRIAIAIALSELGRLPPLGQVLAGIGETGKRSGRIGELFDQLPADRLSELREFALKREEPSFTRAAAIETLGNSGDPALRDFMQSQAHESSSDVAAAAIRALGRIGHPASAEVVIRAMRQTKHNHLRADAAEAAGRIGAPDFLGPLATLLSDDIWTVRYAAGRALRAIPGGVELLMRLGQSKASRQQRMASLVLSEGEAK